jgi:hypothetical protein
MPALHFGQNFFPEAFLVSLSMSICASETQLDTEKKIARFVVLLMGYLKTQRRDSIQTLPCWSTRWYYNLVKFENNCIFLFKDMTISKWLDPLYPIIESKSSQKWFFSHSYLKT